MNEYPLMSEEEGIPLFYPFVPQASMDEVADTLSTRWIGQGPKVDKFEKKIQSLFAPEATCLAVGSGTDALHLSYLLAGVEKDDEVIVPVFTCTATNIPLLYIGAKPVFADIDIHTMNIDVEHVEKLITSKTKAIVCVDYGGYPADYKRLNELCQLHGLKLISDAAHSLGTKYGDKFACEMADFSIFSFQAIKTITTGDGGMLVIRDQSLVPLAKKLRWFGIDRQAKQGGVWENDIVDIGYKYQMTDIAASMGLGALESIELIVQHRKSLFNMYKKEFKTINSAVLIPSANDQQLESDFCPWLLTILVPDRVALMNVLRENGIESAQVHYRNDRYSIFKEFKGVYKNMDQIEDNYLVLPLHMRMTGDQVGKICQVIRKYFLR